LHKVYAVHVEKLLFTAKPVDRVLVLLVAPETQLYDKPIILGYPLPTHMDDVVHLFSRRSTHALIW